MPCISSNDEKNVRKDDSLSAPLKAQCGKPIVHTNTARSNRINVRRGGVVGGGMWGEGAGKRFDAPDDRNRNQVRWIGWAYGDKYETNS